MKFYLFSTSLQGSFLTRGVQPAEPFRFTKPTLRDDAASGFADAALTAQLAFSESQHIVVAFM